MSDTLRDRIAELDRRLGYEHETDPASDPKSEPDRGHRHAQIQDQKSVQDRTQDQAEKYIEVQRDFGISY